MVAPSVEYRSQALRDIPLGARLARGMEQVSGHIDAG